MKRFYANVSPANAALEQTPEVFQAVSVNFAFSVALSVVDGLVNVILLKTVIGAKSIGEYFRTRLDMLANFTLNRRTLSVGNVFHFHPPIALEQSHDDGFTNAAGLNVVFDFAVAVHVTSFAADIGFIRFNFARKFIHRTVLHGEANAVKHEPSGFLGDAQSASEFAGTDSVFGVHNHPESGEPFVKTECAVLKDGSGLDRELLPAIAAFPEAAGREETGICGLAFRANRFSVLPADGHHKIEGVVRVGEVFDCVRQRRRKLSNIVHAQQTTSNALVSQVYNRLNYP